MNYFFSKKAMPTKRFAHSCGLVTGPEIVVAGGQYSGTLDSVDIYNVDSDSWREGTDVFKFITVLNHKKFYHSKQTTTANEKLCCCAL